MPNKTTTTKTLHVIDLVCDFYQNRKKQQQQQKKPDK